MTVKRLMHLPITPALVLMVSSALTAGATYYVSSTTRSADRLRFEVSVAEITTSIADRIDHYVTLLRSGSALFAASGSVTRQEFHEFVSRLDLPRRYPGVQGLGFTVRVPAGQKAKVGSWARAVGLEEFRIWPDRGEEEQHSIVYLEPLDRRNRVAIGYDMSSEPVRRDAMERARDGAEPAVTGKVTLVQEIDQDKQAGFLIYVPVYRSLSVPTLAERRAQLVGYVYSPFRAEDLLSGIAGSSRRPYIDFQVYDDGGTDEKSLFYDSRSPEEREQGGAPPYTATATIEVADRLWTLAFHANDEFDAASGRPLVPLILFGGLGVSFGLFALSLAESRARREAETAADQLRESQEDLRAAHAEAQSANRAKDEFLATVSHELRTPLNAMLGWAAMLRSGHLTSERAEHALRIIERNAQAQARLIDDLLDVSRIISGTLSLDLRDVAPQQPVAAALDAVKPAAEAKSIRLETHVDSRLPHILADPVRLQQIVWNLLTNAIKFTPERGEVSVHVTHEDRQVAFRVRDTGAGIAPQFLPLVFERFRQADSTRTRAHGGVGIGLSIVRRLVELHEGTIEAASAGVGRGATFTVRLPARATSSGTGEAAPERRPALPASLEGIRVLIVDDEADSRDVMARAVEFGGGVVAAVSSAAEAMAFLESNELDVLVSDIAMPGEDGYALLRRVRSLADQQKRTVAAIAVSAHAGAEDRQRARAAGFQMHLAKPVDLVTLTDAIGRAARKAEGSGFSAQGQA